MWRELLRLGKQDPLKTLPQHPRTLTRTIEEAGLEGFALQEAERIKGIAWCFSDRHNRPYLQQLHRNLSPERIRRSLTVTTALFDQTISRWGEVIGVTARNRDTALRNLIQFDWTIAEQYVNITSFFERNQVGGERNPKEGKVAVRCQIGNVPGRTETVEVSRELAAYNLAGTRKVYFGYRDSQVPFLYLLDGDVHTYQQHLPAAFDMLRRLYRGEPIPSRKRKRKDAPSIVLSQDARAELAKVGCIVFSPTTDHHLVDELQDAHKPGLLVVPVESLPWQTDKGPTDDFASYSMGQQEHELTHLKDFRAYNGLLASMGLFELRAFLSQLAYHKKQKQKDYVDWTLESMQPFLDIIHGNNPRRVTHLEKVYAKEGWSKVATMRPHELIQRHNERRRPR
jgi:hypothetical protein